MLVQWITLIFRTFISSEIALQVKFGALWWKGCRECFSLGAFFKSFIFFPLTIAWRILGSFSWFYGHCSCVIHLIFRQILFSLKHFERLGLWEYCYLSVWYLLWYMGALIMEYYMSIQWSKNCVTKLKIHSQCYIPLFISVYWVQDCATQSRICYWLLDFMNMWQYSIFTELLYLQNASNRLDTFLDVESSWQSPCPVDLTFWDVHVKEVWGDTKQANM